MSLALRSIAVTLLVLSAFATQDARAQVEATVKQIKALPDAVIQQLEDAGASLTQPQFTSLTRSPYAGQEVTLTAVVLSDPRASGLASSGPLTSVARIHVFVRDTMATQDPAGMLGYGIQVVDSDFAANGWLDIVPGAVVKMTATVTYFSATLQLAPTSVTVLADDYRALGLPDAIAEPVAIDLADLNQPVPYTAGGGVAQQVTIDFDQYARTNGDYVRVENARVLFSEAAPAGRPGWALTNAGETAHIEVYDVSLRYRNDRGNHQGYASLGFDVRDTPFTPPSVGTVVDLQGFAEPEPEFFDTYGLATPDDIMLKLVPFADDDLTVVSVIEPAEAGATDYAVTDTGESVVVRVLDNDGGAGTITATSDPANGTVEVEGDAVRYQPDVGFVGVDAFEYIAQIGGAAVEATAYVSVAPSSASRIIQDEVYDDWDAVPAFVVEPANQGGSAVEVVGLAVANDDRYLFLRLALSEVTALQENNTLRLYIDADADSLTGTALPGMGADLTYTFGSRSGQFRGTSVNHAPIGLVTLPTVQSDTFEVMLDLDAAVGGVPVFTADMLRIIVTTDEGERVPSTPAPFAYRLADASGLAPLPVADLAPTPNSLRVVSFNAERDAIFGGASKAAFGRLARAVRPDIIGFQEVYNHTGAQTADLVAEALPLATGATWYGADAGNDIVLVSRYPILGTYDLGGNGAFVVDATAELGHDLLIINAHTPCCSNDQGRIEEADEMMAFLRDVKTGRYPEIDTGTPILILGDLNMVGTDRSLRTLLTGDIADEGRYGLDFAPDWDGTDLADAAPRLAGTPSTFTWYSASSSFAPGRLDFLLYSDSVLRLLHTYGIYTPDLALDVLARYGLNAADATVASDHLMIVGDFVSATASNSAPVAVADAFEVAEDGTAVLDVLANDSDPNGDALTASEVTEPTHGTLTNAPGGTWRYEPDADFNGTDSFTYAASDGAAASQATVTITVTPVNDAPWFSETIFTEPAEGATLVVGGVTEPIDSGETLSFAWNEAADAEGDALTYEWEIALDEAFAQVLQRHGVGAGRRAITTHGALNAALTASGVTRGQATQLWHRVIAHDGAAATPSRSVMLPLIWGAVGVSNETEATPARLGLGTPQPNPFGYTARITFALPDADHIRLTVHDLLGRQVAVLVDARYPSGHHEAGFGDASWPSGTYFVRLTTSAGVVTKRAVVAR